MLEQDREVLVRCRECNKLLCEKRQGEIPCSIEKIFIDFHGNALAKHEIDSCLNLNEFINYLHNKCNLCWRDVYWKIWSFKILFYCQSCQTSFPAFQLEFCKYHSQAPKFEPSSNQGV